VPAVADRRVSAYYEITMILILILFLALFLASVENQLLIPLLPTLSRQFHVSMEWAGWLFSSYALSAALFTFLLGPATDRYGRARFLAAGLGLLAFSSFMMSQAESFTAVFILRAVSGGAAGVSAASIAGLVGDHFSYDRRGRVMGIVLSSYFAALILGIPLSAWIAETWTWRTPFIIFSSAAVCLCLLTLFKAVRLPPQPQPKSSRPVDFGSYREILSRRGPGFALLASFLISGGTLSFMAFISGYLDFAFELGTLEISKVFFVSGVAAVVASPFSGWLCDRFSKRGVFLVANSVLVLPLAALTLAGWGWSLFGILFLISMGISFRQTALQTLQTELVETRRRGAYLSLRNCFSQLGIAVSTFISAVIYARLGYEWVTIFAAFLMLGGSITVLLFVEEPLNRSQPGHSRRAGD